MFHIIDSISSGRMWIDLNVAIDQISEANSSNLNHKLFTYVLAEYIHHHAATKVIRYQ